MEVPSAEEMEQMATCLQAAIEKDVVETKSMRVSLNEMLSAMQGTSRKSRERSLAVTKLEEAIMWLGKDLQAIGSTAPYPNSFNPCNSIVEPTADITGTPFKF